MVKLNRMAKRQFYANLDATLVGKDKIFWKTFKAIFSEQTNPNEKKFFLKTTLSYPRTRKLAIVSIHILLTSPTPYFLMNLRLLVGL